MSLNYIKVINYRGENAGAITQFNLFFVSKGTNIVSLRNEINSVIFEEKTSDMFKRVKSIEDFYEAVEELGRRVEKISRGAIYLESCISLGGGSHD
jgi:hypothetical protein